MNIRVLENSISRSLAVHLALLMVAFFFATHLPRPAQQSEPIEISLSEPESKEKVKDDPIHKAIVQSTDAPEVEKAKSDSYLSDRNHSVKVETSARNAGENIESSRPTSRVSEKSRDTSKRVELTDLGVKITPRSTPNYNQERNWAKPQTGEMLKGGQYIQGMKEGEVSALNTKEFVFFSYFERVRHQLDQAWQPIVRENIQKIFKSGRRLASNADYVTRALVTLDQKGQIVKVQVLEESGTHDLDQAAIDALNQAGPYPNPPKGLVDQNGNVQIRWDFILKT